MKFTDEYSHIYERDDDSSTEERMEELRGNIGRGICLYCRTKDAMEYDGHICFICKKCGKSVHEDTYYYWAAGGTIEFDE